MSQAWFGPVWGAHLYTLVKTLILIALIVVPVQLAVAYADSAPSAR